MITVGENTKRKYLLLFGVGVFIPLNKKLRKNSILFGFFRGGRAGLLAKSSTKLYGEDIVRYSFFLVWRCFVEVESFLLT